MDSTAGYRKIKKLHAGSVCTVYRAVRMPGSTPVILKGLNGTHPTSGQIAKLTYEYHTIRSFDHRNIVKAAGLEKINGSIVLVLADIGRESLQNLLEQQRFLLEQTLRIAFKIAESLEHVHEKKMIHRKRT